MVKEFDFSARAAEIAGVPAAFDEYLASYISIFTYTTSICSALTSVVRESEVKLDNT